jgi:hypothetical protein
MPDSNASDTELLRGLRSWLAALRIRSRRQIPLAGDLSPRRYFRVELEAQGSLIVQFYPPELRDAAERFVQAESLLRKAGVRVPQILDRSAEGGWILLEDLGEATLYDRRAEGWGFLRQQLASAVEAAERIAVLDPAAVRDLGSPPLDRVLLRRELAQTEQFLLERCGLYEDPGFRTAMGEALDELVSRLGDSPLQPCHRDLMARNLVPQPTGPIGVLDFQDLRLGPPGYDLASLFHDSVFLTDELEVELSLPAPRARAPHEAHRLRVTAQRCLKAAGTFAAFAQRGARRHLPLLAPTLEHAWSAFQRLPEGAALVAYLEPRWRSALGRGGFC